MWFNGQYYSDFDLSFARSPDGSGCAKDCSGSYIKRGKSTWWAQVKLASGRTGWVNMTGAPFDGTDALA